MNRIEFLNQFHPISGQDYDLLVAAMVPRTYSRGDTIVASGQVQRELFFVREGVQMAAYEEGDHPQVIAFTYAPNLCAIPDSFSLQKPAPSCLRALTDSALDAISYEELQRIFDRSQSVERLFRRMTEAILAGVIHRHWELHALSMEERYKQFCRRSPHLLQLVPHKYIASYLGMDATNFSKLYNRVKF
ncbi:MAG: cyclic nucleotide-binding domain-containing protein [Cyclobacteriaceae bacterium]|nr:cyclic nucleotide-binding domain-containing protein [Cyclobacteriaceae bacterium]